ncbi:MAG: putative DNA binding domain-containing protein [Faecalicoccus sp.]|nr:putative DNA binding domain-containing protein [Faecalicoccus sp.]
MIVQKELFGESKYVEFKEEIPQKHERFLKDVIAFSNTSGGKIIIGICDLTGEVIGLQNQNPFRLSDAITNMISDSCTPEIHTDISPKTLEDKTVIEVEVFPGSNRPYYLKSFGKEKSTYIRNNGTSRPAGQTRLKELEMEGLHISYDTLWEIGNKYDVKKTQELMDSMYHTALSNCKNQFERESIHELTVEKLEDFGILRRQDGDLVPTRAFTLLTNPKDRSVKIQCALFKGIDRVDFIDRKEFRGAIQEQIDQAHQFVLRHTNKGAIIDGLYRQDVYEIPVGAIREIIVNAVLHRSYVDDASIQVSIFDNRIEIDSPGMLHNGLSVADALSGKSKCRNKAIAEAFEYMKIIEGWGTGLPRLFHDCNEMGLPKPKFEEFGDGIKVTIYRSIDKKEDIYSFNQSGENMKVNETEQQMVQLFKDNPQITISELADKMEYQIEGCSNIPHIIPIGDLKDTVKISELCHQIKEPIFITRNGYGDMVIMSIKVFEVLKGWILSYFINAVQNQQILTKEDGCE